MADNFRFAQLQPYSLAGAGEVIGATTITLKSMLDIDGATLTMAGTFGTIGFGTLDPGNGALEEQISFSGLTNNSNGTTTLTGVKSVTFVYPYTQTSGLLKTHAGSTPFVISNTSGFYDELTSKDDDETVSGLWTFAQFPQKSGSTTPTAAAEFASKAYVDSVAGGLAVTNQILVGGTAGENLTAGNVVYFKSSDQKWYKADSSDSTKSVAVDLGIAQTTVLASATLNVLRYGLDATQTGLTAGSTYYLSTSGGVSTTKGTFIRFLGRAKSTTALALEADAEGDPEVTMVDGSRTYGAESGSATAYVVTLNPSITAYKAGQVFSFLPTLTNTTSTPTINFNGVGAKSILINGSSPTIGSIQAGVATIVEYDGTNFQIPNPGSLPTGSMTMYGGTAAPGGWLLCDGTSYLRATYPALFSILSTTFGSADGTHFNVPDMRGRTPVGVGTGTGGGASGTGLPAGGSALTARALAGWVGEETHTMTTGELVAHTHTVPFTTTSTNVGSNPPGGSVSTQNNTYNTGSAGSTTPFNVMQPIMSVNFIIKI